MRGSYGSPLTLTAKFQHLQVYVSIWSIWPACRDDRILTLFTSDLSKLDVLARGVRKTQSHETRHQDGAHVAGASAEAEERRMSPTCGAIAEAPPQEEAPTRAGHASHQPGTGGHGAHRRVGRPAHPGMPKAARGMVAAFGRHIKAQAGRHRVLFAPPWSPRYRLSHYPCTPVMPGPSGIRVRPATHAGAQTNGSAYGQRYSLASPYARRHGRSVPCRDSPDR